MVHVFRIGKIRNMYKILVVKPLMKRLPGTLKRRWEDNIKMNLRKTGCLVRRIISDGGIWCVEHLVSATIMLSRDNSVTIATDYGLDDWMIGVRILAGAGNFSLHHHVQTSSGANPASCPTGTGLFPG
jgi:hypothetical protein